MRIDKPELSWLEDPEVFRVNRLDAHSDHVFFESEDTMRSQEKTLYQSLNGSWRFLWSAIPEARPKNFYEEDFNDSAFYPIEVPGHIQLQACGQIQYVNTMYPWDGRSAIRPPKTDPLDAEVGSYVKCFRLNESLRGKRVCISFQGVEQAFYVWLNGHFVGYAEDSFTPSDFDLTPWIRPDENRLCVEVHQRSSAGWLEDQDFFRFFGIFRDVYLYAKPAVHLEDLWIRTALGEDHASGILSLRLRASSEKNGESVPFELKRGMVFLRLKAPDGSVVLETKPDFTHENGFDFSGTLELPKVQPWSHERPALYKAELCLKGSDGSEEWTSYSTGFRRIGIVDGVIRLNGERLIINGVNRHEWSAERGRSITPRDQYAAIEVLRRNNINAVRTCHYPNQTLWYELCDAAGIYVMDETNLESHGSWQKMGVCDPSWNVPGSLPEWKECVVDRARSMFERDKNHVSILFWSCGNESYAGEDIRAMGNFFRENDPSRLVHYEGVFWNREFEDISDVESQMYAPPERIREYLESEPKKPFLLCEYMHDMGNSLGGMESYIRLLDEYPQYQGGFIWDYMDQALWRTDALGRRVLSYGGDFGDRPTDYAFSGNGILFADGTEKPAMQEVRYWYSAPEQRRHHDEHNAAEHRRAIELLRSEKKAFDEPTKTARTLEIYEGDATVGVKGAGWSILFSLVEGGPVSLKRCGTEWLYRAPRPAFWRAATENDKGNGFAARSSVWMAAEQWSRCTGWEILAKSEERLRIVFRYEAPCVPGMRAELEYDVDRMGRLNVTARYFGAKGLPELPEFGVRFATPEPVQKVSWEGLSGETYPDRMRGGIFGLHTETPHIVPYLVPQEMGCHMQTIRAKLMHKETCAAAPYSLDLVMTDKPFAFSVLPCSPLELENATHREELPVTGRSVVSVFGAMRGVGGIDSWGADVEPAYHVSGEENIEFSFEIFCGSHYTETT